MTNETTNETKGKRNRRTRAQVAEALRAKLAKIEAQIAGTFDESSDETLLVQRLKRAIRRRDTVLKSALTLLNGKPATQNSPAVSPIDAKIAGFQKRLDDAIAAKARAIETIERLPADQATLNVALAAAVKGELLEFPTGLYAIPGESERTETEVEAASANEEQSA